MKREYLHYFSVRLCFLRVMESFEHRFGVKLNTKDDSQ